MAIKIMDKTLFVRGWNFDNGVVKNIIFCLPTVEVDYVVIPKDDKRVALDKLEHGIAEELLSKC
jgi:hypothetical protein